MSLITPDEINALSAGGGLSDTDLQTVIDREEKELTRRFGSPTASRTETFDGGDCHIFTKRQISSVATITEVYNLSDTPTTLTTTDYHVRPLEGRITRLPEYLRWGREVVVTYTPTDDSNLRKQVLVELIRLAVEQDTGAAVQGLGYAIKGGPADTQAWQASRESLYARLAGLWTL